MHESDTVCHALKRLNGLLVLAADQADQAFGLPIGAEQFRRLYIERAEVNRVLGQEPRGLQLGNLDQWKSDIKDEPLFQELARMFRGFDETDFGILLLAFAPEFDSAYEWIIAYLQDDATRRRPTVELAVVLFQPDLSTRNAVLRRFAEVCPLRGYSLLELADQPDNRSGLLGKTLRVDEQFSRWLLGVRTLDRRLVGVATLTNMATDLAALPVPYPMRTALESLTRPGTGPLPHRLYLHGPEARGKQLIAEAVAHRLKRRLLTVDVACLLAGEQPFAETVRVLLREASWFDNLLFFDGVDAFHASERQRDWGVLTAALARHAKPVVLAGTRALPPHTPHPVGFLPLELPVPDLDDRVRTWHEVVERLAPRRLTETDKTQLAERYPLTRSQIEQTVAVAVAHARWRAAQGETACAEGPAYEDFAQAARNQGSEELEALTHKICPRVQLDDLVVSADVKAQLEEIVGRVQHRHWVQVVWGFGQRQSYGHGVNALFAGPSGTGKTMAAEAIANKLGKYLFKIDLPMVMSKYIGETEQRLERIFREGENTQAVLFFDEADSLLGKRSEVRDAHDRYANLEVSYLLQRIERYDGLILLATNLLGNLDEAFMRRMAAVVHFVPPDLTARRVLWQKVWPPRVPLAAENGYSLNNDFLSQRFELTGGGIFNAAMAAAFATADRWWFPFVTMWDVLHGVKREYQKLGQALSDKELGLAQFKQPPAKPNAGDTSASPARDRTFGQLEPEGIGGHS